MPLVPSPYAGPAVVGPPISAEPEPRIGASHFPLIPLAAATQPTARQDAEIKVFTKTMSFFDQWLGATEMVSSRPCVALHAKAGSVVALVFSER